MLFLLTELPKQMQTEAQIWELQQRWLHPEDFSILIIYGNRYWACTSIHTQTNIMRGERPYIYQEISWKKPWHIKKYPALHIEYEKAVIRNFGPCHQSSMLPRHHQNRVQKLKFTQKCKTILASCLCPDNKFAHTSWYDDRL